MQISLFCGFDLTCCLEIKVSEVSGVKASWASLDGCFALSWEFDQPREDETSYSGFQTSDRLFHNKFVSVRNEIVIGQSFWDAFVIGQ